MPMVFMVLRDPLAPERDGMGEWWGLGLPLSLQSMLVAGLMLAVGLLAMWRSMGRQLMVRATPWAWVVGLAVLGGVLAGFFPRTEGLSSVWVVMAVTALAATYLALFTEPNNRLAWQAVFFHWANGANRRMWQALPLWPVSWTLALAFFALYALTLPGEVAYRVDLGGILGLVMLHCLRDCGIYHFFALRNTTRKPTGATLLTLFMLGVVVPGLVATVSPDLAKWFEPLFGIKDLLAGEVSLGTLTWLAMAAQLALIAGLVAWRWRQGNSLDRVT
jgi:hypothetical protein